jgi:hypothetical protein
MDWSWPIVRYALELNHPYKTYDRSWNPHDDKRKAVGYFMERLFIIWTMLHSMQGRYACAMNVATPPHITPMASPDELC